MLDNSVLPGDLRSFNRRLIEALEKIGISYALGGSVAAMIYSEPRLTIDIDLMIAAPLDKISQLVKEVQSWQIYISPWEAIVETSLPSGMPFNVIDGLLGAKLLFQNARHDALNSEQAVLDFYQTASKPKLAKWYDAYHQLNEAAEQDRAKWLSQQLKLRTGPGACVEDNG
jgi:hypothetical protein